ncbi:MAG: VWA domain-containing protein [Saprospirales bacterium]|nr:MAG: VWA domain-containing protein [Saprospirales bacterium]
MGNLTFLWPIALILVPVWIILAYYYQKAYSRRSGRQVSIPIPKSSLGFNSGVTKWVLKVSSIVFNVGVVMVIVGLARPGYFDTEVVVQGEGIDIVIALDLSSSMLAQDFYPNRLEVSKKLMKEFIQQRPLDRIAVVGFAGESFTQSPLTNDHDLLIDLVAEMECGMIADGTAIGMGLATSLARLRNTVEGSGVVILLTDGVNNTGYIDPMTAAQMAYKMGVRVYTIGVGSIGVARAPVERRRDGTIVFGNVRVEIDEELLREISSLTAARYYRADNEQALQEIYDRIDELEQTEVRVENVYHFQSLFRIPLLIGMILVVLGLSPSLIFKKFP